MQNQNSLPLVTIITPAFNSAKFIKKSIESVLCQTYANWVMILIDDNSNDGTVEICQSFIKLDARIKLLQNQFNIGPAESRNRGIDLAVGKYIAFLDSDDWWEPNKLYLQISQMESTSSLVSFTSLILFDEFTNKRVGQQKAQRKVTYADMLITNKISLSSAIYNREVFKEARFSKLFHEDYVFWLTLLKGIEALGLEEPLTNYLVRKGSVSGNKLKSGWYHWRILRDFLKLPILKAIRYFCMYVFMSFYKYRKIFV